MKQASTWEGTNFNYNSASNHVLRIYSEEQYYIGQLIDDLQYQNH